MRIALPMCPFSLIFNLSVDVFSCLVSAAVKQCCSERWGACVFWIHVFHGIYDQVWVCQILGLTPLQVFPSWDALSFQWLLPMSIPPTGQRREQGCYISCQPTTACICSLLSMTILTSVIRFLVILIGILHVIIRDAEHLILCPFGDCLSSSFFLKV